MADYIYTLETRLSPDQQKAVALVLDAAKAAGMNLYLTGGAIRDIITGFPIRDLDFTVQGNALKLQKDLERAGAVVGDADDETRSLLLTLPGGVRAEIAMARSERYDKPGKPPQMAPATIIEDLRRRDFTVNAMALSLNEGSRGLLMDPFNGVADIEAKVIRVLHNYAFLEDPSRMIRATRFSTRFHWPLEERTQARYESGKENGYIEYIRSSSIGYEIEQLAYEDDPLGVLKAYEKEGWLKVLNPRWSTAKVDTAGLGALMKTRQQMSDLGYAPDVAPLVLHFLTERLGDKDISDLRRAIPRKDLVDAWKAVVGASGDDFVSGDYGAAAGGGAKDQEFLHQVAASAAEDSVAGDDGTPYHAADSGVCEDRERCVHAVVGWQAAFADGDAEVSEAAGSATSAASTTSAEQAGQRSQGCGGCGSCGGEDGC
jgi:tRNA nucleotidyltransferase (CCA-adding enzyme)